MSVPVNKRKESQLEVNLMARDLCVYTLQITSNEKHFPKSQDSFTQIIRLTAIHLYSLCWEANNIMVNGDIKRYEMRMELQAQALDKCNSLCALIDIAKPLFHLSSKRVKYWTMKVVELRNYIYKWHINDKKRLKPE